MNNFNAVFSIVQNHCNVENIYGNNSLHELATEAGITDDRLHFYLNCLHQLGYIDYSPKEEKISLTEKGKATDQIFSS